MPDDDRSLFDKVKDAFGMGGDDANEHDHDHEGHDHAAHDHTVTDDHRIDPEAEKIAESGVLAEREGEAVVDTRGPGDKGDRPTD